MIKPSNRLLCTSVIALFTATALYGCAVADKSRPAQTTAITEASQVERGRYLIRVAGCNDCHTAGWHQMGEKIPESLWLAGVPVGWRGPWGTTYASNLRLFVKDMDEATWTATMRARDARPPMPWASLHAMTDGDLKAVYQYIKELGPVGKPTPEALPPGQEPKTPFIETTPTFPKQS